MVFRVFRVIQIIRVIMIIRVIWGAIRVLKVIGGYLNLGNTLKIRLRNAHTREEERR